MTVRFTFDLAAVRRLADHADQAPMWMHPAGSDADGPGLLLCRDSNGVHLTSNGLPAPQPPADQPGTLDTPAVFARERTPGIAWQPTAARERDTVICEELTLCAPGGHPLLDLLRAGADAGFTTFTVTVSATGLHVTISRYRDRSHRPVTA